MADRIVSFIPENDDEFQKSLDRMGEAMDDFRVPFNLIRNDWYVSNRIIFGLRSAGLYQDLAPAKKTEPFNPTTTSNYGEQKKRAVGFKYPILKRTGELARSLTSPNASGAENFVGRQTLIMGTSVEHAKFHQSDRPRNKIPQRKMIFISGGPAEKAKDSRISGRLERWTDIINTHIEQVLTGKV